MPLVFFHHRQHLGRGIYQQLCARCQRKKLPHFRHWKQPTSRPYRRLEAVSWLRVGMLFFGGIGYHELHLPKAVYTITTVSGIGNLGFSYGANAKLTIKILPRLHMSGQGDFRGLYVSDGTFQNYQLVRDVESSTLGLLLGASINFAF